MTRKEWIAEAARILSDKLGESSKPEKYQEWATSLADDSGYYNDGYAPMDAVLEELSYA